MKVTSFQSSSACASGVQLLAARDRISGPSARCRGLRCARTPSPPAPRGWRWRRRRCPAGGRSCRRRTAARSPRRAGCSSWCICPAWMPPEATGIILRKDAPVLLEEQAVLQRHRIVALAADVVVALGGRAGRLPACRPRCRHGCDRRRRAASISRSRGTNAVRLLPRVGASARRGADAASCRCGAHHFDIDWIAV